MTYGSAGIFANLTHLVVKFVIQGSTIYSKGAFEVVGYLNFHVENVLTYQSLVRFQFPPTEPNGPTVCRQFGRRSAYWLIKDKLIVLNGKVPKFAKWFKSKFTVTIRNRERRSQQRLAHSVRGTLINRLFASKLTITQSINVERGNFFTKGKRFFNSIRP